MKVGPFELTEVQREALRTVLGAFRERLAVECDKEKALAEERLAADRALHREHRHAAEHQGQRAAAFWCAKHVREVDVDSWFESWARSL